MGNAILHVSAAILDTHQLKARLAPLGLLIAIQLPGHVVSELPTRLAKLQSRYPGEQFALIILDKGSYTNGEVHQLEGTIAQLSVPVLALIPVSPNDRPENTLTGKPAKLFLTRMTGPIIVSLAVRIMLYGTESLPPTDYGVLARALHFPKSN